MMKGDVVTADDRNFRQYVGIPVDAIPLQHARRKIDLFSMSHAKNPTGGQQKDKHAQCKAAAGYDTRAAVAADAVAARFPGLDAG